MSAHDDGKAAHAAGTALTANPHAEGTTDRTDWTAGWSDAQAEAVSGTGDPTAATAAPGDPSAAASVDPPAATTASGDPPAGAAEEEEPTATEVVDSLGDEGFDRIMELLSDPPLGDLPDGAGDSLPPDGDVPEDLGDWLEAWKQPLTFVAVDTAISAVKSRIGGPAMSRGRLKELYRGMAPDAMAAAMQANAETIAEFADQRVAEAGLISSLQAKVTEKAAGFLLNALLLI